MKKEAQGSGLGLGWVEVEVEGDVTVRVMFSVVRIHNPLIIESVDN